MRQRKNGRRNGGDTTAGTDVPHPLVVELSSLERHVYDDETRAKYARIVQDRCSVAIDLPDLVILASAAGHGRAHYRIAILLMADKLEQLVEGARDARERALVESWERLVGTPGDKSVLGNAYTQLALHPHDPADRIEARLQELRAAEDRLLAELHAAPTLPPYDRGKRQFVEDPVIRDLAEWTIGKSNAVREGERDWELAVMIARYYDLRLGDDTLPAKDKAAEYRDRLAKQRRPSDHRRRSR